MFYLNCLCNDKMYSKIKIIIRKMNLKTGITLKGKQRYILNKLYNLYYIILFIFCKAQRRFLSHIKLPTNN